MAIQVHNGILLTQIQQQFQHEIRQASEINTNTSVLKFLTEYLQVNLTSVWNQRRTISFLMIVAFLYANEPIAKEKPEQRTFMLQRDSNPGPVRYRMQRSNQTSYETTNGRAGHFKWVHQFLSELQKNYVKALKYFKSSFTKFVWLT